MITKIKTTIMATILSLLMVIPAFSALHNDFSIQYINSPVNTIPENSADKTPLAIIYSSNGEPYKFTDTNFYPDTYQSQYRLNASELFNIDYEAAAPHYTYTLTVSDNVGYSNIVLSIGDVNESPRINNPQPISITENTPNGTDVYQVIASDPDTYTGYNQLTYSIVNGSASDALTINTNGMLKVTNKSKLDYESNQLMYLTVMVSDGKYDDMSTITIYLINVNDNPPQISDQDFSVGNDIPNNTWVGTVSATDPDGDTLSYQITDDDNIFAIDSSTGKITVIDAGNIQNDASYFVTVSVSDGDYTQTAEKRIDVNNINYAPRIDTISDYEGTVNTARHIVFHVEDSNGEQLFVSISSSVTGIVPNTSDNIQVNASSNTYSLYVYEGSEDLTLTLLPLNTPGDTNITVSVTDGDKTDETSFNFKVNPNTPPSIQDIDIYAFDINAVTSHSSFTVADSIGEMVTITISSGTPGVVPNSNIQINNSGRETSIVADELPTSIPLTITPIAMGAATIYINATDAGGLVYNESFTFQSSIAPQIGAIDNVQMTEDVLSNAIAFTVLTNEPGNLTVSVLPASDLIPSDASHITICHNGCIAGSTRSIDPVQNSQENLQLYVLNNKDQYGQINVTVCVANEYGLTQTEQFAVTIKAENDAPVFVSVGEASTYTEQGAPVTIISSPVIQDVDDTHLNSARIVISENFHDGDVLSFQNTSRISGLYSSENQTLELTGVDTITAYETAFQSITYFNNHDNPNPLPRTFSITVNDGLLDSAPIFQTLTLIAINDPPTISATTRSITAVEETTINIAPDMLVSDPDNTHLVNATIAIIDGYNSSQDTLSFAETGNITSAFNTATGVLSLSGVDTVAAYQDAFQAIQYRNSDDNPTTDDRLIQFTISDGHSQSLAFTQTVIVQPENDAPVISGAGGAVHYVEDSPEITVSANINISDIENHNMLYAIVKIDEGYQKGADQLSTIIEGFTVNWDPDSQMLIISGSQPMHGYETVLEGVKYKNLSQNPTTDNRVITFMVSDGKISNEIKQIITIEAINDAPFLTAENLIIDYTENANLPMSLTVTDYDNAELQQAIISITDGFILAEDQLSFTPTGNIVATSENATITLTGQDSVENWNLAFDHLTYKNLSNDPLTHDRKIQMKIFDGEAWSQTITQTIQIISVDDPPLITIDQTASYTENTSPSAIAQSFSITDFDSVTITHATVQIGFGYTETQDILRLTASTPEILTSYQSGTLTLTGASTLSAYNDIIRSLTYENTSDNPQPLTRAIIYQAWNGPVASVPVVQNLFLIPINDAPELQGAGTMVSITENHSLPVFYDVQVSDIDDKLLDVAWLTITQGYHADQDALIFEDTVLIDGTWYPETGQLQLKGLPASPQSFQKAINSVEYTNSSDNPDTDLRMVQVIISDGSLDSNALTGTIQIVPVNDIPVLSGAKDYTYVENDQLMFNELLTLTDPDSLSMATASVRIIENFRADQDVLSLTPVGNISAVYDETIGVLTVSGPENTNDFLIALSQVVYENTSDDPEPNSRTIHISIHDGIDESLPVTETITIFKVNDPPQVTFANPSIDYTEQSGFQMLDPGIQLSDPDSLTISNAMIQFINNTYLAEDTLQYSQPGNIIGNWDAGTGTMTLSGVDTVANYQIALANIAYTNHSDDPSDQIRTISWMASDGDPESLSVTQFLQIVPVNDIPILTGSAGNITYIENTKVEIDIGIDITDVDNTNLSRATIMIAGGFNPNEDMLVYPEPMGNITSDGMKAGGVLVLSGDDTINLYISALKSIQYDNLSDNPSLDDRRITFSVNDGEGSQSSTEIERIIHISPLNDAPQLDVNTGIIINEGDSITLTHAHLSATDPDDPDEGLFYTIESLPAYGILFLDSIPLAVGLTLIQGDIDNQRIHYFHDGGESQNDQFSFIITDTHNAATEPQFFTITIMPVNDSPVITSIPEETAIEDILYAYTVTVSDPDDAVNGTDIIFSLENEPEGMTIFNMGIIHWLPLEGVLTSGQVNLIVRDGLEDGVIPTTQSFTIAVTPVDDPPQLSEIQNLMTYGNTQAGPIAFTVIDAEGGPLTLNVYYDNPHLLENALFQGITPNQLNIELDSYHPESYFLTMMPAYNQYGTITTTIMATDSTGMTATTTFILLVDKVTITVQNGSHGQIDPGHPAKVKKGEWIQFRIEPDVGYQVENVWVDNQPIGPMPSYTFWHVTEPHSISATFAESIVYTITTDLNEENGAIDPKGVIPMTAGDQPVFHIMPSDDHIIADVLIDGQSIGPVEWYTFPPLDKSYEIKVLFSYVGELSADFSYNIVEGNVPLTVHFHDTSQELSDREITAWHWDFGDGFQSVEQHPEHTYMTEGLYSVQLVVSGKGGQEQIVKADLITVLPSEVDFTTQIQTGPAPLTVTFINQTILSNVNSWDWDFGDTGESMQENPVHVYENPGFYTVKLIARVDEKNPYMEKVNYIHVTGRKISGTVTASETDNAISNATVELWQNDQLFAETLTNVSGEYTFNHLPISDNWSLSVWPDDLSLFLPSNTKVQMSTSEKNLTAINFTLEKAPSDGITGSVYSRKNGKNEPLDELVTVSVYSEKLNYVRSVMTDESGHYTVIGLPMSDDYRVSAWSTPCGCELFYFMEPDQIIGEEDPYYSARTYQTATKVSPSTPPIQHIELVLEDGGSIFGKVTDSSGAPLKNIWVNAWSDLFDVGNSALTDNKGEYEIPCLRSLSIASIGEIMYRVEINPPDYPQLIYQQVKKTEQATGVIVGSKNINFKCQKGMSIQGSVKDENGIDLPNIPVRAWSEAFAYTAFDETITDASGKYTITNLPNYSDYRVAAYPLYYPIQYYPDAHTVSDATPVNLSIEDATDIDFHLDPGAMIRGIVYLQNSSPAPMGLIVNIWSESTQTGGEISIDANGRFEMNGLQAGVCDYMISIHQPPYVPSYYGVNQDDYANSWDQATPVCPSKDILREMILVPGHRLSGVVIHNNQAIANAVIQAWAPGSNIWAETTSTNAQTGQNFVLQGLADGHYEIRVQADGFADKIIKDLGINANIDAYTITMSLSENQITGTVYGLETDKIVQISAWSDSIQDGDIIQLVGDDSPKTYKMTGLNPASDYRVELWSLDYPYQAYPDGTHFNDAQLISVKGTMADIDFHLKTESTGSISGTITPWPDIQSGDVVFVDAVSHSLNAAKNAHLVFNTSDPLSYALKGLPFASDYIVTAWSNAAPMIYFNGVFQEESAEKVSCPDDSIHFTLSAGMQISGILYDESNNPIAGELVAASSASFKVYQSARTNRLGEFEIKGLPKASDYQVCAFVKSMPAVYFQTSEQSTMNPQFARWVDVSVENADNTDIHIPSGKSICGFLRDTVGRAVQFAWISAQSTITGAQNETFSDNNGNFCIQGLPEAIDYQLTIQPDSPYVDTIYSMVATDTQNLKCTIETGFEVFGTVHNHTGDPLTGIEISLWSSSRNYQATTNSNIRGEFLIEGTPATTDMFLTATPRPDQAFTTFTDGPFAINQQTERNIVLSKSIEISGVVLSKDNQPISGALITAYAGSVSAEAHTTSDSEGRFTFNHLPEAVDYQLTILHSSYATKTLPFVSGHNAVQIILAKGGQITGHVFDESGHNVVGARVDIQSDDQSIVSTVLTNLSGEFEITGLPLTDHFYTLNVSKTGYASVIRTSQTVGSDVQLLMLANSGTIEGTITTSSDINLPKDIKITVRLFDQFNMFVQRVQADNDGKFVFSDLSSDKTYKIKCSTSDNVHFQVQWIDKDWKGVEDQADAAEFAVGEKIIVVLKENSLNE